MKFVVVASFVAFLAMPAVTFAASDAEDAQKVGASYVLTMEGMT